MNTEDKSWTDSFRTAVSMRMAWRGSLQYACGLICFCIIGAVVVGCRHPNNAAVAAIQPRSSTGAQGEIGRLTVQPNVMATGTITVHEGMQRLDSLYGGDSLLAKAYVYVPKKCVGKRRSPLLVILHGSGWRFGSSAAKILQQSADSNGVILLAPTSFSEDEGWGDTHSATPPNVDVPRIDASIGAVLRHYAIDPERIALIGSSAGAGAAMTWGYVNGDVFKLVIIDSGFGPERGEHQFDGLKGHGNPKFYIVSNTAEASILSPSAHLLQRAGYSTTFVQDPYLHGLNRERAVEQFAWLVKNWR